MSCPHARQCIVDSGERALKIPLSKAVFSLSPLSSEPKVPGFKDQFDVQLEYDRAYREVFAEDADSLDRIAGLKAKIREVSDRLNVSVRTYILCQLHGHKFTSQQFKFTAKQLTGEHAERRIDLYRKAVTLKYGAFDAHSLSLFTGIDTDTDEKRLFKSEVLLGQFIIGNQTRKTHKLQEIMRNFFKQKELHLDPAWLAINPHYWDLVLKAHTGCPHGAGVIARHRHNVATVMREMSRKHARCIFAELERCVPRAISYVLENLQFSADHFEIHDKPVTDTAHMWLRIGTAIQHYWCLKLYEGDVEAKQRLRSSPAQFDMDRTQRRSLHRQ